ncbi:hypothetical protein [Streptomyces sp. NBC_00273]|uniref:hypothetical protein n=1 Tax=Streptomyces sp. NBC_00273 TaxID=2903644 RepID=UPI002E2A41A9|nr:hypothetical protein [Streptomyces sp. NBC_00273]
MITEPELDGEWEPARPAEVVQDTVAPGARAPDRPWPWVAAAVVATSALWAGGLYAFGDRTAEPEIRYRVTDDLCGQFKAPTLEGLLGGLADPVPQAGGRHRALDWASCSRSSDRPAPSGSIYVAAVVELHKMTDPKAEFAASSPDARWFVSGDGGWESVPGLGEEALVTRPGPGDGIRLRVRDGGAVFTIVVTIFEGEGESDPRTDPLPHPDRDALVAAAAEDARALMAALRKS